MNEQEQLSGNDLDRAIAVVKTAGYVVERAEVYRARENRRAAAQTQMQNERGEWVPAIPEPYFLAFGRTRCDCGEIRWGRDRYREHFALAHILGMAATR